MFLLESDLKVQLELMLSQILHKTIVFHTEDHLFMMVDAMKRLCTTAADNTGYVLMYQNSAVMHFKTEELLMRHLQSVQHVDIMFYGKSIEDQVSSYLAVYDKLSGEFG